jgi:hypothetical protein
MTGFFEGRGNPHTTVTPHELGEHQDVTITTPIQGDTLQYEESTDTWINRPFDPSLSGGHIVADEGSALPQRQTLDFTGDGVTLLDNSSLNKTVIEVIKDAVTDLDGMTPGTAPTGVEKFATTQGGDPVSLTVQQIAGNPIRAQLGHSKTVNKSFSNFTKLSKTFSAPDGSVGVACGLEPFLCYGSGTNSGVYNLQSFTNVAAATVSAGTTTTGRGCLEHLEYPILYNPVSYDIDYRKTITMGGLLPTGGEGYTLQCGFIDSAPEIAVLGSGLGVFFEFKTGDTNWHAVWISNASGAANYRRVDTGIPVTIAGIYTLRILVVSHPTDNTLRPAYFYINGDLVATIPRNASGVTAMAVSTRLSMAEVIKKAAGTTGASITVTYHYSEIENAAPLVGLDV